MSLLLRIDSSALSQGSHSKSLADHYLQQWQAKYPDGAIVQSDLSKEQPDHISEAMIQAMYTPEDNRSEQQLALLTDSDAYISTLKSADTVLFSVPMYNFTIPSTLKAYIDHILRVGETFQYGDQGPEGLLNGKKVILIVATGGDYTSAPYDAMDFVVPYLKTILSFIGLTDVSVVQAPNMARTDLQESMLANAKNELDQLV